MHTAYVKNIPVAHGEMSVVMSDDVTEITRHSCELAIATREAGIGVLIINTAMSPRRFSQECEAHRITYRDSHPKKECRGARILFHTSVRGNLAQDRDALDYLITQFGIGMVILTSWEWASSSYGRKNALTYYLRELMLARNVAVVVYSQASTKPVIGKFDRGGIGKLATLAVGIVQQTTAEEMESAAERAKTRVATDEELAQEAEAIAEASTQLLINKVNELPEQEGTIRPKIIRTPPPEDLALAGS